jgi:hypothetical protein
LTSIGSHVVWLDLTNESDLIPTYRGGIFSKVTRLSSENNNNTPQPTLGRCHSITMRFSSSLPNLDVPYTSNEPVKKPPKPAPAPLHTLNSAPPATSAAQPVPPAPHSPKPSFPAPPVAAAASEKLLRFDDDDEFSAFSAASPVATSPTPVAQSASLLGDDLLGLDLDSAPLQKSSHVRTHLDTLSA